MKKGYLTILVLLLLPTIDGCINCKCEDSIFNYDYSAIEFYQLNNLPVPKNEDLVVEVSPMVEIISENHNNRFSGSTLMACSCISYYYPIYTIDQVEVFSQPSFFDSKVASSVIGTIVEVTYYDDTQSNVINLGETSSPPQFSINDAPYFTARFFERPLVTDSTYTIIFKITQSTGNIVMNSLEIKWE